MQAGNTRKGQMRMRAGSRQQRRGETPARHTHTAHAREAPGHCAPSSVSCLRDTGMEASPGWNQERSRAQPRATSSRRERPVNVWQASGDGLHNSSCDAFDLDGSPRPPRVANARTQDERAVCGGLCAAHSFAVGLPNFGFFFTGGSPFFFVVLRPKTAAMPPPRRLTSVRLSLRWPDSNVQAAAGRVP